MWLCQNEKYAVILIRFPLKKKRKKRKTCSKYAQDSGEPVKMIVGKGSQKPRYNSEALHQVTVHSDFKALNTALYGAICPGEHGWIWHASQLRPAKINK